MCLFTHTHKIPTSAPFYHRLLHGHTCSYHGKIHYVNLKWWHFCPSGHIWQCLDTFWMVSNGGERFGAGLYGVSRGQDAAEHPSVVKAAPTTKTYPNQLNINSAEVEKPWYIPSGVKGWFSSPSLISFLFSIKHRWTLTINISVGITQA